MKIKKVLETPKGEFTFEGELSAEEHAHLIEIGLLYYIKRGLIPVGGKDLASYGPGSETVQ